MFHTGLCIRTIHLCDSFVKLAMGVDIKGVVQDNQKLFLSIIGILVLSMFMAASSGGANYFDYGYLSGDEDSTTPLEDSLMQAATPVNNGKNGIYDTAPAPMLESDVDYQAVIVTNKGSITVDLYESQTPVTVNNFVFLSQDNFYDGTSFHRVKQNFVIQGGDPLGTGEGGPGYTFRDEIIAGLRFKPYVLAMANSGPNTNGSQFFITTKGSTPTYLDGSHTIFGEVIMGQNVIDQIELVAVDTVNYDSMPLDAIRITDVRVIKK